MLSDVIQTFRNMQVVIISQPFAGFAENRREDVTACQFGSFGCFFESGVFIAVDIVISQKVMLTGGEGFFEMAGNFNHVSGIDGHNNGLTQSFADTGCSGIAFGIKQVVTILQLTTHDKKTSPCLATLFKVLCSVGPDTFQRSEFIVCVIQRYNGVPTGIDLNAVSGLHLLVSQVCYLTRGIRKLVIFVHKPGGNLVMRLLPLRFAYFTLRCGFGTHLSELARINFLSG